MSEALAMPSSTKKKLKKKKKVNKAAVAYVVYDRYDCDCYRPTSFDELKQVLQDLHEHHGSFENVEVYEVVEKLEPKVEVVVSFGGVYVRTADDKYLGGTC